MKLRQMLARLFSIFALNIFLEENWCVKAQQPSNNKSQPNSIDENNSFRWLLDEHLAKLEYENRLNSALKYLSKQLDLNLCSDLDNDDVPYENRVKAEKRAETWKYYFDKLKILQHSSHKCKTLKDLFGFNEQPLSKEEAEYPLAYGILAYKFLDQIYYMLSAFYHPQNEYCIALDKKTSSRFKKGIDLLGDCFPNIQIIHVDTNVKWCEYGVLSSVLTCLDYLVTTETKWKYYQYLSGFDLPLKTNHEVVRILKQLNNTINMEILPFPSERYGLKWGRKVPYNLKLYKTSLSALIPYNAAVFMVSDKISTSFREYLDGTICPDESYWLTLAANPQITNMPSSINGSLWLQTLKRREKLHLFKDKPLPYYISRFQVWEESAYTKLCKGKIVSGSCVFGVGDVSTLLKRAELVVHKLYFDYQPAAYFCIYKHIRKRALSNISSFNATVYKTLPFVAVSRGENVENTVIPIQNYRYSVAIK